MLFTTKACHISGMSSFVKALEGLQSMELTQKGLTYQGIKFRMIGPQYALKTKYSQVYQSMAAKRKPQSRMVMVQLTKK